MGAQSLRIAKELIRLVSEKVVFTDANIRPGFPISIRTPSGYEPISDELVTPEEVFEFCEMADGQWKKRMENGGGQFDVGMTLKDIARLRCNFFTFGAINAIGSVVRKQPIEVPKLDDLGVPYEIKRLIQSRPKGLILVSGPTGSGKSTTLAAIIEYFNETTRSLIITIEQPIEYEYVQKRSVIIQREVPTNVSSFQSGVESSKRQDPDVIMVGEVRDKGTVDAMLMAACSGHLVLATTHARSAQEACEAVLSYYSDEELKQKRGLLASSLLAINSQVLLPTTKSDAFVLGYELLVNNAQFATHIRDGKTKEIANLMQSKAGISNSSAVPLNERLAKMVEGGVISREEAMASAYDKETLARRLSIGS